MERRIRDKIDLGTPIPTGAKLRADTNPVTAINETSFETVIRRTALSRDIEKEK